MRIDKVKLSDLLALNLKYTLPLFQRTWSWKEEHVEEFWNDLRFHYGQSDKDKMSSPFFIGTMIFLKDKENPHHRRVVDGQQRLTTIFLLKIAMRQRLSDLKKKANDEKEVGFVDLATRLSFVEWNLTAQINTGEQNLEDLKCKFEVAKGIRDIFALIAKPNWTGSEFRPPHILKKEWKKLEPSYSLLKSALDELDFGKVRELSAVMDEIIISQIEVDNLDQAYEIFETVNSRGLELDASNLIKNLLFSEGQQDEVVINNLWEEIESRSDPSIVTVIKRFEISRTGHLPTKRIYKTIKENYGKDILKFASDLNTFSKFHASIKSLNRGLFKEWAEADNGDRSEKSNVQEFLNDQLSFDPFWNSIIALVEFDIQQTYSLIHAALQCFNRTPMETDNQWKAQKKALLVFILILEKYHFINNCICQQPGNQVEKLYARSCVEFGSSMDFNATFKVLWGKLFALVRSKEDFIDSFIELKYSKDNKKNYRKIMYIFDRFYNFGYDPKLQIFNPTEVFDNRRTMNIDHWAPQAEPTNPPQNVQNIGNLLVMRYLTNSRFNEVTPSNGKADILLNQQDDPFVGLPFVQNFINKYGRVNWDEDAIKQRAQDLARAAFDEVWEFPEPPQ